MSDEVETSTPQFVYEPDAEAGGFVMLIAKEEEPTVDGRMFAAGAISWRELPIPLTLNRSNTTEGQHKTADGIGAITEIWREGNSIYGKGFFSADELGQTARQLIQEGTISGVSADVGGTVKEELAADDTGAYPDGVNTLFTKGKILGVTALLHASFDATKIAVDNTITAAAGAPWSPPSSVFANPHLSEPTPLTITADGKVFGHAALWNTCHVGYQDRCVQPPRSAKDYAYFNIGQVITADAIPVEVGRITAETGHAPLELAAQPAKEHYDHTGFAAAYVRAGEDQHGIWFAGQLAPEATEAQIANLRAAGVSGDWRNISGNLEMVGLLAVNTPGFPVPRPKASIVAGAQMSLVAAGMVTPDEVEEFKKKKGCGCKGCEDTEEMSAEDCGCDEEELVAAIDKAMPGIQVSFEFNAGKPIDWSSDFDENFLAQIIEHFEALSSLAVQANDSGSKLSAQVQGFASYLKGEADETVAFVNRSLGRSTVQAEEVKETNDEPVAAYETEEVSGEAPAVEGLSIEARLMLMDLDLDLDL